MIKNTDYRYSIEKMCSNELILHMKNTHGLSEAESEVIFHVLKGRSLSEISDIKKINYKTVSIHKRNAYEKIGTKTDIEFMYNVFHTTFHI
ncbi:LuxR family transcriptional regulator [Salmonella enterica]|uniref:LuxR family transcriptional regulator n=1 Tax=Salmonella enterica TaxID=28901 RepID=A0A5T4LN94_SALER|nr:helix-turn-helix transcriptional regulator [Salmonella enterica]EBL7518559.1 LuxR family transcriptional regulator [Salmonella enterica]